MAFPSDITASGDAATAAATNNLTMGILSYPGPGKAIRILATSTSQEPTTCEISHRVEGQGASKRTVRSVTARKRKINTATGNVIEGSVTVTYRVPDDTTITSADIKQLQNFLVSYFTCSSANTDRLLRGEI